MDLGLHEIIERNARDHEEKKNQLVSKIAALEAALKMTTDKAESDQKSLQSRHEIQLATENQINLKLRGEAAILKKSIARFTHLILNVSKKKARIMFISCPQRFPI